MKVIVNYPTDKEAIDNLYDRIAEFKAILMVENIKRLNISDKGKRKIVKEMISGLKSGKYII